MTEKKQGGEITIRPGGTTPGLEPNQAVTVDKTQGQPGLGQTPAAVPALAPPPKAPAPLPDSEMEPALPAQGGAALRQKMIDAGAPSLQVDEWVAEKRQAMLDAGAPADEVGAYWGDKGEPNMDKAAAIAAANLSTLSPVQQAKLADSPMDALMAGFMMSASGLAMRGRSPDIVLPQDAGLLYSVASGAGQIFGDLPFNIAGAGVGMAGGTAVAGPVGTVVGGFAGGAALPAAIRHVLMDQYSHTGGTKTWGEFWGRVSNVLWETGKETAVGTAGGVIGAKVGVKVFAAAGGGTKGAIAGVSASLPTMAVTGTAVGGALEGHVPDAKDFQAAVILAFGMHFAGATVGATNRYVQSKRGKAVEQNFQDIYANTGIHPMEAVMRAQTDEVLRQEILAPRDDAGQRRTPGFDAIKPPEPKPYTEYKPEVTAKTEEVHHAPKPAKKVIEDVEQQAFDEQRMGLLEVQITEYKEKAAAAKAGGRASEALNFSSMVEKQEGQLAKLKEKYAETEVEPPSPAQAVAPEIVAGIERLAGALDSTVSSTGAVGRFQIDPQRAKQYGFDPTGLQNREYAEGVARTILADFDQRFQGNTLDTLVAWKTDVVRTQAWINQGRPLEGMPIDVQRYLQLAEAQNVLKAGIGDLVLDANLRARGDNGGWVPEATPSGVRYAVGKEKFDWLFDPKWKNTDAVRLVKGGRGPNGQLLPDTIVPAPELITGYVKKLINMAGTKLQFDLEGKVRGASSGRFIDQVTLNGRTVRREADMIFMPNGSDAQIRLIMGNLGPMEIFFHELGHTLARDFHRLSEDPGRVMSADVPLSATMRKELVENSQIYRAKHWQGGTSKAYLNTSSELFADAVGAYLSNPAARKRMPLFSAEYGPKLKPFLDVVEKNLPIRVGPGEEWGPPPGQEQAAGAGNGGAGVPPAGGGNVPAVPGAPGAPPPKPKQIEDNTMKYTPDEMIDKINSIVAPPAKGGILPDWLNPRKLWAGFDMQLQPARNLDKKVKTEMGYAGIEDMARMTYASRDTAQYFMRVGPVDPVTRAQTSETNWVKAYENVKENGGTLEGFLAYRLAQRTIEKAEQGIATGVDLKIAERYVNHKEVRGKYEAGSAMMREVKDASIDYATDSGIFSGEAAAAMKELNREHIVMRRVIDDTYNPPRPGLGFQPRTPVKRMKGSDLDIVDPNTAEVDNLHTIIAMADRNRAVGNIVNMIEAWRAKQPKQIEDGKDIPFYKIEDLDGDVPVGKAGRGVILDENGVPVPDRVVKGLQPFMAMRQFSSRAGTDDFVYFRNGKAERWRASDPDLAKLMQAMFVGDSDMKPIVDMMAKVADMQRLGITTDPSFPLRTLTYGQFTTSVFAEQGSAVPYKDIMKGVMGVWKQDAGFMEWWRNGGAGSSIIDYGRRYLDQDMHRIFEQSSTFDSLTNTFKHPIEAWKSFGRTLDVMARYGNYRAGTESGTEPFKAAMLSRKAYLDYAEPFAAQAVNKWARTTVFMPSGFKDLEQFTQAMRDRPAVTAALGAAILTTPTALVAALNWVADQDLPENEKSTNIQQWQRDAAWIFPKVGGLQLKIAKPPGPGTFLFSTLPNRYFDWLRAEHPKEFGLWAAELPKSLLPTFTNQVVPPMIPVIGTPVVENWANQRMLTGRPLIPKSMEDASGPMQYTADTSETAKAISSLIGPASMVGANVSPITIDNYARGWLGTMPLKLLKVLEEKAGVKERGRPKEAADNFFVGSFFIRNPGAGQALEDFHSEIKVLKAGRADLRLALERHDASEIKDATTWKAAISLTTLETAISNQRKVVNAIYRDKDMTDGEKITRVDSIMLLMTKEAQAGALIIRQLKAGTAPPATP